MRKLSATVITFAIDCFNYARQKDAIGAIFYYSLVHSKWSMI